MSPNPVRMGKDLRLSVRIDTKTKTRLNSASSHLGMSEAEIVNACVEAFLLEVEENGQITLPLAIIPKRKKIQYLMGEERPLKVAEDQAS